MSQLVQSWLRTYNNDTMAVLGLLDIENSLDVCQQLLSILFAKSTPEALTSAFTILDEKFVP